MSDDKSKPQTPGTLLRGPDGHLYFIPQEKLAAFRVPEQGTPQMTEKLAHATAVTHTSIPTEWIPVGLCLVRQDS
ncbi:MAG TPA: hypothetical protein VHS09_00540 [Polyangiaceae bacterium]|jgi:hypothetical protein|nr:hypothetical protein [Polyangiaceae bacterium]